MSQMLVIVEWQRFLRNMYDKFSQQIKLATVTLMHNLAECTSMHQEVFFTWPLWANSNMHWQL